MILMNIIDSLLGKSKKTIMTDNFKGIYFELEGKNYYFKPTKDITAYEVALLLPLFKTYGMGLGIKFKSYLEDNNLIKHFELRGD